MIHNTAKRTNNPENMWIINSTPTTTNLDVSIKFTYEYNGVTKESDEIYLYAGGKLGHSIAYLGFNDAEDIVYSAGDCFLVSFTGWLSDSLRTITFLEPPTGDLLKWLQANAVKQ
ncbi:hypothetical protein DW088_01365 [Butyricicoccus sp. AM05-1]|jgi:hypothetical protein|uniref:hypothetical protein n=1 Tax=Butyricicoccus sp. AM05-1 TaxID=2292004 RepID=UPI000E53E636|nr:hypothetical protein [Butyricicoccus sp. AM05-1]RHO64879.1 hypothetical protein DW088_01365 [Butyricicoccus sp. AM05-1]